MVIKVCITIIAFVVTINNGQIGLFREVYRRRPLYKILGILEFSFVASPILCYLCPKPFSLPGMTGGFQNLTLRRGQRRICIVFFKEDVIIIDLLTNSDAMLNLAFNAYHLKLR
jgi:hypothetical protein